MPYLVFVTHSLVFVFGKKNNKIFAFQAEGMLKLHRHQDAVETLLKGPNFEADACTKFLGPIGSAYLLVIRAQVDMAAGRLVFCTI